MNSEVSYRANTEHHARPVRGVRVRVPASTANLGSGFDALGLALALHDEIEAEVVDGGLHVDVHGEGAGEVPTDERHLVVRALRAACDAAGFHPPGIALRCRNRIPHSRGLGSSAAAVIAGVLTGFALAGQDPGEHTLQLAAGFERHADNAAATLLGGLVVAWSEGERFRAVRLEPHLSLAPVLLVPTATSSTVITRGLLPERVPHGDAAFAAGRAALAVHALTTDPALLLPALDDRLHQPYRRAAYPATGKLVDALRAAGVAAAVSGAGPAVLALPEACSQGRGIGTGNAGLPDAVDLAGFTAHRLDVDRIGAVVEIV